MSVTKLLIANRGDIAGRIIRTCREMQIPTVAVYSDADRGAMHVRLAEESVHIGPTPSRESYLKLEKLLEVCKQVGADAIHPGYGFLAEDPDAARQIQAAGLTWLGPSPEVLEKMACKLTSRKVAEDCGVPVLPAILETMDDESLLEKTKEMGFPVMVKPILGRDGKGMRLVKSATELRRALPRVKGEAIFSFWDERVYIEKFLAHAHYLEVQIAGDRQGNVIHLWEREGSIQRRFQQAAEEAPSPNVTPELRQRLGEAAVKIAKAVGYVGVGTVEFLMDDAGQFYFLEMTCRIQGGHAVTEWITGVDLVRLQVDLANGKSLPLTQDQVPMWGHAVQVRVNAEDPDRDFAPSSGKVTYLRTPKGHNLRDDSGIYMGWELSPFYAPIMSKLSAWGPSRERAIARLRAALGEYRVGGVRNNIAFFKALMEHKPFLKGDVHNQMLEHAWWKQRGVGPNLKFAAVAALFDEFEKEQVRAQQPVNREGFEGPSRHWKLADKFNRL